MAHGAAIPDLVPGAVPLPPATAVMRERGADRLGGRRGA
jgi:hypothetical protein